MNKTPKSKVLIVDDHPVVQHGLMTLISDEPDLEVCGVAESVSQALKLKAETDPDVVLIDISLGEGNGIDLIREIKDRGNPVRMIVVSVHEERIFGEVAKQAGASGYVHKGRAIEHIPNAIRRVLDDQSYFGM